MLVYQRVNSMWGFPNGTQQWMVEESWFISSINGELGVPIFLWGEHPFDMGDEYIKIEVGGQRRDGN